MSAQPIDVYADPRAVAQAKLEAAGIDAICDMIMEGMTQREIAVKLQVGQARLNAWLYSDPVRCARARGALAESAEAWLDMGLDAIKEAMRKDSDFDVNAARAYAQECARRAAVRNPQYRDKPDVQVNVTNEVSAPAANVLQAAIQLARQAGLGHQLQGLVIEHAPQPAAAPEALPGIPEPPTD